MRCDCQTCELSKRGIKVTAQCPRLRITKTTINATTRKLRVKWSAELAEDVNFFKGVDLNTELK